MSVRSVGRPSAAAQSSVDTRKSTLVRSPTSVSSVGRPSFEALTLPSIRGFIRDRGVNESPSENPYSLKTLWCLKMCEDKVTGVLMGARIHTQTPVMSQSDWTDVTRKKPCNHRNRDLLVSEFIVRL